MESYLKFFFREFQYPEEAAFALLNAYRRIEKSSEAAEIFGNQILLYNENNLNDYNAALDLMDKVAELSGAHRYEVHLLLFIFLSQHTRQLYAEKRISYDIFYDSMSDLKWKLFECHNIYGIWGSFVAWWFNTFFNLTRFALGRLQFETAEFNGTYSKNGFTLNPKDTVINIHIPSSGPLKREDCHASYQKAAEFYKDIFVDKPVAFMCSSWLLYPKHKEFLPQGSNILTFMEDFDIIESSVDEKGSCLWRIFGTTETSDIEKLPQRTSLQRAYIDWLRKGNVCGGGLGVFFI